MDGTWRESYRRSLNFIWTLGDSPRLRGRSTVWPIGTWVQPSSPDRAEIDVAGQAPAGGRSTCQAVVEDLPPGLTGRLASLLTQAVAEFVGAG